MKNLPALSVVFASAFALAAPLAAQTTHIVSDPLGFNSVPCPIGSDTILGVPFRPNGSLQGALDATAIIDNRPGEDTATLTLAGTPGFTTDEFANSHYAKFSSGASDGRVYPITANGANTLTIDLNGDNLPVAVEDDTLVISTYWTLDSLFPPADATTDPTTTGHAIVASANPFSRATEILLPRLDTPGINLSSNQAFYIYNGAWRKFGEDFGDDYGFTQIYPDIYIIIRQKAPVTSATTFKCSGEVELGTMAIPLSTQATGLGKQDNFIGMPRPIDVTLDDLGLVPGAFEASANPFNRADELLVFDNNLQAYNKSAADTYYYYNGAWRKFEEPFTSDFGTDTIPAGVGFMIRKAETASGATVFWNNPATYDNQP